jgi:hypothetical protein
MISPDDWSTGMVDRDDLVEATLAVRSDRVRRVNHDLPDHGVAILSDELLHDVEPEGQNDDVGLGKRLFDWQRLHPPYQLLRELSRLRHVGLRNDHALAPRGEICGNLGTDISETNHGRLHDETPFCSRRSGPRRDRSTRRRRRP